MNFTKRILCGLFLIFGFFAPNMAFADGKILSVDALDISGLVPIVLNAFMSVANGTYSYFVGEHHDGIIYLLIWGFLAFYIALYLVKLYMPKFWTSTFGFSSGDNINNTGGMKIVENILKPSVRALIAVIVLLQIPPQQMAKYVINPFLSFGSLYTTEILKLSSTNITKASYDMECPRDLLSQGWSKNLVNI